MRDKKNYLSHLKRWHNDISNIKLILKAANYSRLGWLSSLHQISPSWNQLIEKYLKLEENLTYLEPLRQMKHKRGRSKLNRAKRIYNPAATPCWKNCQQCGGDESSLLRFLCLKTELYEICKKQITSTIISSNKLNFFGFNNGDHSALLMARGATSTCNSRGNHGT